MDKIYYICYNAYECDDYDVGIPYPIYFTDNEEECLKKFEEYREELKKWEKEKEKYDYEEYTNNKDEFEYSVGKWIYIYKLRSAPLSVDLRWDDRGKKSGFSNIH